MPFELTEEDLAALTQAFKDCEDGKLPKTTKELQDFVDKNTDVVQSVIDVALDEDQQLTQTILENAGVKIREENVEMSEDEWHLHMNGLWAREDDEERYENTKNSYIGSTFIQWCILHSSQSYLHHRLQD